MGTLGALFGTIGDVAASAGKAKEELAADELRKKQIYSQLETAAVNREATRQRMRQGLFGKTDPIQMKLRAWPLVKAQYEREYHKEPPPEMFEQFMGLSKAYAPKPVKFGAWRPGGDDAPSSNIGGKSVKLFERDIIDPITGEPTGRKSYGLPWSSTIPMEYDRSKFIKVTDEQGNESLLPVTETTTRTTGGANGETNGVSSTSRPSASQSSRPVTLTDLLTPSSRKPLDASGNISRKAEPLESPSVVDNANKLIHGADISRIPAADRARASALAAQYGWQGQVAQPEKSTSPLTPNRPRVGAPIHVGHKALTYGDRRLLEDTSQMTGRINEALNVFRQNPELQNDNNAVMPKATWGQYMLGSKPADPKRLKLIQAAAYLSIKGAGPFVNIGRGRYMVEQIKLHLPQPSDSPALMYEKIKWLQGVVNDTRKSILDPFADVATPDNVQSNEDEADKLLDQIRKASHAGTKTGTKK